MYTYSNFKLLTYISFHSNGGCHLIIDCTTLISHSHAPKDLKAHHKTSLGTLSNAFSKSTNAIYNSFFLHRNFSCICLTINMASVVSLPGRNPNCCSSIVMLLLSFFSMTLSNTFIAWSSSLIPLYEPHSRASPFPLYTGAIQLLFQSSGIFLSAMILLNRFVIHVMPSSPKAWSISDTTPDGPAAFPTFVAATL